MRSVRVGPTVRVVVEYDCTGCRYSETSGDRYSQYGESWWCEAPSVIEEYGSRQYSSHDGTAFPVCPYRNDDEAIRVKQFHDECSRPADSGNPRLPDRFPESDDPSDVP